MESLHTWKLLACNPWIVKLFTCVTGEGFIYFSIEFKIQATHVTLSTYGGKTIELVGYV